MVIHRHRLSGCSRVESRSIRMVLLILRVFESESYLYRELWYHFGSRVSESKRIDLEAETIFFNVVFFVAEIHVYSYWKKILDTSRTKLAPLFLKT